MKRRPSTLQACVPLLLVSAFMLLACNLFGSLAGPSLAPKATGAGPSLVSPGGPTATAEPALSVPITRLLALRSITLALQSSASRGSTVQVAAEVDAAGNYHLKRTTQGDLPQGFPASAVQPPPSTDLYIVSGSAYAPDENGKMIQVDSTPWSSSLETILRGFYGPGMWLLALPQGALTGAGSESRGGFQTTKYVVSGKIGGPTIAGTIWIDQASSALIGADLQVPAELLGLPGKPAPGPMKISLQVTRTEVAPITPPGVAQVPAAGATPGTTPAGGGSALDLSKAGLPPGFPIYPGAHNASGVAGLLVQFTVDADVRTVSDFYDKQLRASGWTGFSTGGAVQAGGEGSGSAATAGPPPSPTPVGWMSENTQIWTKGSWHVMIAYSLHPGGGTDLSITLAGQ